MLRPRAFACSPVRISNRSERASFSSTSRTVAVPALMAERDMFAEIEELLGDGLWRTLQEIREVGDRYIKSAEHHMREGTI
jgi:hypothetical protein